MLAKIEFRSGSFLPVDTGGMFQSSDECRDAFMELLGEAGETAPGAFVKFDDFQGKKMIINKGNINSIEIGYRKGGATKK